MSAPKNPPAVGDDKIILPSYLPLPRRIQVDSGATCEFHRIPVNIDAFRRGIF